VQNSIAFKKNSECSPLLPLEENAYIKLFVSAIFVLIFLFLGMEITRFLQTFLLKDAEGRTK